MQTRPYDTKPYEPTRHRRDSENYTAKHKRPDPIGVDVTRAQQLCEIADGFEQRPAALPLELELDRAIERPYSADCAFAADEGPLYGAGTGLPWAIPGPDDTPTAELHLRHVDSDATLVMSVAQILAADAPRIETVIVLENPDGNGYTATTVPTRALAAA
jgi:hypothetical protein